MATACRLAVEAGAAVVGVSAIYVPVRDPLDAPRPEREQEVAAVQAMAASLADEYGVEYRSSWSAPAARDGWWWTRPSSTRRR